MRRALAPVIVGAALAVLAAGCSWLPSMGDGSRGPTPPPGAVVVPPAAMTLNVSNGSTLPVALVVNGTPIEQLAAGDGAEVTAAQLPPLPWAVEVRAPSGRVLVGMTVHAGDAWSAPIGNGGTQTSGAAARADLSCGRIDVWSGQPMYGPMPGPGVPGDCDP